MNKQPKMKNEFLRFLTLLVLVAASMTPMFILASEINDDEYWKSAAGMTIAAGGAAVIGIYRVWKGRD